MEAGRTMSGSTVNAEVCSWTRDKLDVTAAVCPHTILRGPSARLASVILGIACASACAGAEVSTSGGQSTIAEKTPPQIPWEKASATFGGYFSIFDSSFAFSPGLSGKAVDLSAEDLLGLDSTLTVFRADALYRPGPRRRHQVDFSYASYRRSGEATLQNPIDVGGGVVIPATTVYSVLNFDIIRTSYSFAFLQSNRARVGGGLAVYVLPIEYGLTYATGNTPPELQPSSITVPVPALTLNADFLVMKKLYLRTALSGMHLSVSGFDGTLFEAGVALEYRVWKHLALGVGYSGMLADIITTPGSDYPGADAYARVNIDFHGAVAFAKLTF